MSDVRPPTWGKSYKVGSILYTPHQGGPIRRAEGGGRRANDEELWRTADGDKFLLLFSITRYNKTGVQLVSKTCGSATFGFRKNWMTVFKNGTGHSGDRVWLFCSENWDAITVFGQKMKLLTRWTTNVWHCDLFTIIWTCYYSIENIWIKDLTFALTTYFGIKLIWSLMQSSQSLKLYP